MTVHTIIRSLLIKYEKKDSLFVFMDLKLDLYGCLVVGSGGCLLVSQSNTPVLADKMDTRYECVAALISPPDS